MGTWIFLGAFFAIAIGLYMGLKDGSKQSPAVAQLTAAYVWPELDEYEFDIVGEGSYQQALKAFRGDMDDPTPCVGTALIIPEDNNPYDDKAVKVTIQGLTIGYLSREDARSFRKRLAAMKLGAAVTSCGVQITGGHTLRNGQTAHLGARLDIKRFE